MITTEFKPTKEIASKVLKTVDAGLCKGKGVQIPGQMCIEAAVCFALDLPHSDEPPCVGSAVRSFKITLNDCNWSSDKARAAGMRKLAIAQLGSDSIDQIEFSKRLALKTIRKLVPKSLRVAAKIQTKEHAEKLEACAVACESVRDLDAASDAARAASDASDAASYASYAASYASDAASDASEAASDAARAASDASYAASYASYAASYASYAASDASYAASDADKDSFLILMAEIALEVLIELKSPGSKFIYLCEL